MSKILVTGSAGLVGRQITKDLDENNLDVFSCYNIEKPYYGIPIHLDISKKEQITDVLHNLKPDVIIHLAAITDVEQCELQKDLASLINTKSTEILARESARQNIFFVYLSTDYVFDGKKGRNKENDIPNPINFYGKSKLDGEVVLNYLSSSYVIIRTSTPFGIHPKKKSFPIWVKKKLELKKKIQVIVDQYTSPTFVPNLSKMIIEVVRKEITGIIHLADSTRISRYGLAEILADKLNLDKNLLKPTKIEEMDWNAKRPQDSSLDVSTANKILDNKPQKIEHSLDLFIDQIKNSSGM